MNLLKCILDTLTTLVQLAMFLFTAHFAVVTLFLWKKKPAYSKKEAATQFAILVAARNEAGVICELLESLEEQDYPKELYQVFVAPNNCTDDTADVARRAGAEIFTCPFPVRCKGDVLRQAIPELLADERHFDAICIFDADNIVDPQFLARTNDAFLSGVRVAQGYRDSKNPYDSWVSAAYSIYFKMNNLFYNKARHNAGMAALVSGTGFSVKREVFETLGGWHTQSLTEDSEFTAQCILAGETVAYLENAIFFDEQPIRFSVSLKQRKRWSAGLFQVSSLYRNRFLAASFKNRSFLSWDCFMFTLTPYFQLISVLVFLLPIISTFLFSPASLLTSAFWFNLSLPLLTAYLGTIAVASATVLYRNTWNQGILKGVLTYGFFLLSWVPLQFYCLVNRDISWEEIRHTRHVRHKKIMQNEFS